MCTVVYKQSGGRLFLVMNRDERRGRAPESPPNVNDGPPRWLAPSDGEKGGTWIGVNEHGMTACLLNAYGPGDTDLLSQSNAPSRGNIIPEFLTSTASMFDDWVGDSVGKMRFPSFTLLVWGPDGGRLIRWRRNEGLCHSVLPEDQWAMETSSAWRTKDVVAWRTDRFNQWIEAGGPFEAMLPKFSVFEAPGLKEWSPFMTRPFSATRSLTLVDVDSVGGHAEMIWWPRSGDGSFSGEPPQARLSINLKTGAAA